jgi:hypothetical protein
MSAWRCHEYPPRNGYTRPWVAVENDVYRFNATWSEVLNYLHIDIRPINVLRGGDRYFYNDRFTSIDEVCAFLDTHTKDEVSHATKAKPGEWGGEDGW